MYDALVIKVIADGGPALALPVWGLGLAGVLAGLTLVLLVVRAPRLDAPPGRGRVTPPVPRLHGTRAA